MAAAIEVRVVWISSWQVFELPSGLRHVWGRDIASGEGRVSSPLTSFHPATASLRSIDGQVYKLVGSPKADGDGEYLWQLWLSVHRLTLDSVSSVSDEVWRSILLAAASRCGR